MYTGIILAGGKSSRMKTDKAVMTLGNKTLTEHIFLLLKSFCNQILISTNNPENKIPGCTSVEDEIENIGPIGGIYTCLKKSKNEKNIIISCDTPFVSADLIKLLINNYEKDLILITEYQEKTYPFPGIYPRKIIETIEEQIKINNYKIKMLIEKCPHKKIHIPEKSDFLKNNFLNLNSISDYNKARKIWQ